MRYSALYVPALIILFFVVLLGLPYYWIYERRQARAQRNQIGSEPFPDSWLTILSNNFPLYQSLPKSLQETVKAKIKIFIHEKKFEGCGGLNITDEIRVTIAAYACLLIAARDSNYYSRVSTILVYPSAFVGRNVEYLGRVVGHVEGESFHAGEAWKHDYVVLAWDQAKSGARDPRDGYNPALHEFAHQLDVEDGWFDGTPTLPHSMHYSAWTRLMNDEFEDLSKRIESASEKSSVLSTYASKNIAEFFAVATEAFFEKPIQLQLKHEELYLLLSSYYNLDPLSWKRAS